MNKKNKEFISFVFRLLFGILCLYIVLSTLIYVQVSGSGAVIKFFGENLIISLVFLLAFLGIGFISFGGTFISAISKNNIKF